MVQKISEGIRVQVEAFYQRDYSNPLQDEYMFAYRVTLTNLRPDRAQLMSRHWHIEDGDGSKRTVEGEGVVGRQPLLYPEGDYQYVSGANMRTPVGRMSGHYTFRNPDTGAEFEVSVPAFDLIYPPTLN